LAFVLVACAGASALAAPLTPIRPRAASPALAPLAPRTSSTDASAIDRACGTDVGALPELYAEAARHEAESAITPLPTPHSTDVGEIAVNRLGLVAQIGTAGIGGVKAHRRGLRDGGRYRRAIGYCKAYLCPFSSKVAPPV